MTFTHALSTNNYGPAKFIVSANVAEGTHTTIASAITSASSGDDIFIRPGTYTEDLTLKVGVNLIAWPGDSDNGQVTIIGKCTLTTAGTVSISNIRLQTNSDFCVAVTGSAASILNIDGCYINASNNTAISYTVSNAASKVNLNNCIGNLGTTGIAYFAMTSTGVMIINGGEFFNTGSSLTASTVSAGTVNVANVTGILSAITTSSTAGFALNNSSISTNAINTTSLTLNGSGQHLVITSRIDSGTASAISVGNTTTQVSGCSILSTNTNTITGAGTLTHSGISFIGTGTTGVFNTTTISNAAFGRTGTWTPALAFGGSSTGITYSAQSGIYTVIGNICFFEFYIQLTNKGAQVGVATITMPLTGSGSSSLFSIPIGLMSAITLTALYTGLYGSVGASTASMSLIQVGSAQVNAAVANTSFANTSLISTAGFYQIV